MDPSYTNPFANGGTAGQVPSPVLIPTTPVTGDIVLQPEKKGKKKLVIMGFLASIVAIVLIVIMFLSQNQTSKKMNVKENFFELYNYVENENWEAAENEEDLKKIFNELKIKSENFIKSIDKDKNNFESVQGDADLLRRYVLVIEMAFVPENKTKQIIDEYNKDGEEKAKELLKKIKEEKSGEMTVFLNNEFMYYDATLREYMMYDRANCIKDGDFDFTCGVDFYGDSFELNRVDSSIKWFKDILQSSNTIKDMQNILRTLLKEIKIKVEVS